jgi:argininosuccinate lyase
MEYLIKKGVAYREAHDIVGTMIKTCTDKGKNIADLTAEQLKKYSPQFGLDVKKLLNPETSVKIKKSLGSTNPQLVQTQLNKWKKFLHA